MKKIFSILIICLFIFSLSIVSASEDINSTQDISQDVEAVVSTGEIEYTLSDMDSASEVESTLSGSDNSAGEIEYTLSDGDNGGDIGNNSNLNDNDSYVEEDSEMNLTANTYTIDLNSANSYNSVNRDTPLKEGVYYLSSYYLYKDVSFVGKGAGKTIIDGKGKCLYISSSHTFFQNLTFRNCHFIYLNSTKTSNFEYVVFTNCVNNKYSDFGAIYSECDDLYISFYNSDFINNKAKDYGAAIYIQKGRLRTMGGSFINNTAGLSGGAIFSNAAKSLYLGSSFINCSALKSGGGVHAISPLSATIKYSKFTNDSSAEGTGGGLHIESCKDFSLYRCHFNYCISRFGGAAAIFDCNGSTYLNSLLYNNASVNGGGFYIACLKNSNDFLNMKADCLYVNFAGNNGGAIYTFGMSSKYMSMDELFIRYNTAVNYGGANYFYFGTPKVGYMTYSGNTAKNNPTSYNNYSSSAIDFNELDTDYLIIRIDDKYDSIPKTYTSPYVTSVKDQMDAGVCWAFASIATLESCIYKATGKKLDLSEENLINLITEYSPYGGNYNKFDGGGSVFLALSYLANWLGPVYEKDDHYSPYSLISSKLNPILHIQNVYFIQRSSISDLNSIKEAILKYGAVGASIFWDESYLTTADGKNYYCPLYTVPNHEVVIVGWDDTYSRNNFKDAYGNIPKGDGAWIVKNSHGSDYYNKGYNYVSYYDMSLANPKDDASAYTFIFNNKYDYDKVYQYDSGVMNYFYGKGSSQIWYKNKFTATESEYLSAISTYFINPASYTYSVYVNGVLKQSKSGSTKAGYYTFNLDNVIHLNKKDTFEVVFKITTSKPQEAYIPCSVLSRYSVDFSKDVSFYSADGKTWKSLIKEDEIACIKAFTFVNKIDTKTVLTVNCNDGMYNPVTITVKVSDKFGNLMKNVKVNFKINDQSLSYNTNANGVVEFVHNFDKGTFSISATYDGDTIHKSSTAKKSVTISRIPVMFTITGKTYQNNANITIKADKKINENVVVSVGNIKNTVKLVNGVASLSLNNLANGKYVIKPVLSNTNLYESSGEKEFTLNILKTSVVSSNFVTYEYSKEKLKIQLLDEKGNPLKNRNLTMTANGKTYSAQIGSDGICMRNINLPGGKYNFVIKFAGEKHYFASQTNIVINVKKLIDPTFTITQDYNNVEISVSLPQKINTNANFVYNSKTYSFAIKNGKGVVKLNNLANGKFSSKLSLNHDTYEANPKNLSKFTVNVVRTSFTANDLTTYYKSGKAFTVKLINENNKVISGKTVIFKIFGKEYSRTTDSKGMASLNINANPGKFNIEVKFNGDKNKMLVPSSLTKTINVKSTINLVSTRYTLGSKLSATVVDNEGKVLSNTNVPIFIVGKTYTLKSDSNGKIALPINLKVGTYKIKITNPVSGEVKEQSISVVPRIGANKDVVMYHTAKGAYKVRAFNDYGNPVGAGEIVKITVCGKTYICKTDKNGYALLNLNLNPKTYGITAEYKGFKVSNKVTVKPILISSNQVFKKATTYKYSAKLLDTNGKIQVNKVVSFLFKGKKYTAKTSSYGYAIIYLKVNLNIGKHYITTTYGKISNTNTITIKK